MGLNRGTIRAKAEVEGVDAWQRDLRKSEKALDNFGKGASGINQQFRSLGPSAAVATAGIAAVAAAAVAAGAVVARVAREVHSLGLRGGDVSAVATAFEQLASPDLLSRLQDQTQWLISEQRLMQESVQVLRSRLITESDWVRSLGAITRLSQDAGENADDMIAAFAQMASGGGMEALGQLGVNILGVRDAVREAGFSMESAAGKTMAMTLVSEEMADLVGGEAVNSASNYNDAVLRLTNRLESYRDEVARTFAEDERLVEGLQELEEILIEASPDAETLGEAIADLTLDVADATLAFVDALQPILDVVDAASQLNDIINTITQAGNFPAHIVNLLSFLSGGETTAGDARSRLAAIRGRVGTGDETPTTDLPSLDPFLADIESGLLDPGNTGRRTVTAAPSRRRGGGGGGGGGQEFTFEQMLTELSELARLGRERAEFAEREAAAREIVAESDKGRLDVEREIADISALKADTHEAHMDGLRDEFELRQQTIEQELALETALAEAQEKRHKKLMGNFEVASAAVGTMGQIFGMIADAQDEGSKAADQWRKAQGVAMGIKFGIEAGAQVAAAVGMFAQQNYPGGALALISATLYTAQSVAAFSQLAQSGGGAATTTGAAAAPTFRPAEPEKVARSADAGDRNIIIEKNYYLSEGLAELGAVVESSSYEMGRQRVRADVPNNEYR